MKYDFFQKQYDFELDQRNGIASATNTPIVALTILGGALASIITGFKYSQGWTTYIFLAFVILTCISMLVCIYKVVRTFLGYSYQKIPGAGLLKHVGWAELAKPNVYRASSGFYKLTLLIIKSTITVRSVGRNST